MEEQLKRSALKAIGEKVFPGCVLGVLKKGRRFILPVGTLAYDAQAVTIDTVYDLASITKSIPVASLAAIFIAKKQIRLSDAVKNFIPELQNDFGATIEDLLRYRVHGGRMSRLQFRTFEEIRTHIFEHGFESPPGESRYTNLPAYLLGVVLERVGAQSLAALAHHTFFEPLHMSRTTFFPAASDCAPTEVQNGQTIRGIVHDESARVFAQARRTGGHAGLFSTASDLLIFFEALSKGEYAEIVESAERGLGWTTSQPWFMGEKCSTRAFAKTGFTGTSVMFDPTSSTALVLLSNRTFPVRPSDAISTSSHMNVFRRSVADVVFEA